MPYMLAPKNYAQTYRPNLYNMAYRRVGAYKGMGRLHPSNYLEVGGRPNRIGETSGQYNTLGGQLALLPPSLRGFGQFQVSGPPSIPVNPASPSYDPSILAATLPIVQPNLATTAVLAGAPASIDPNTGLPSNLPASYWPQGGLTNNQVLLIAGGVLLFMVLASGRR